MRVGQKVTYVDADGIEHDATIVDIHGDVPGPRQLDLSYTLGDGQADGDNSPITEDKVVHESMAVDGDPPFWRQ